MEGDIESIEYKQSYLRNEIIDKGFNEYNFINYIKLKTGENEISLEGISFDKLKEIVQNYQKESNMIININSNYLYDSFNILKNNNTKKAINETNKINSIEKKEEEKETNKINSIEKKEEEKETNKIISIEKKEEEKETNKINSIEKKENKNENYLIKTKEPNDENEEEENKEDFKSKLENPYIEKKYISCKKQEKNSLTEMDDLKIIITSPEQIKKNLFSFSYYQYTMIIPKLNFECKRNQSDFEYLHLKLISLYPSTIFPPFPYNSFFDNNTIENVNKKVRKLNLYINTLVQNKLILSNKLIKDFLLIPLDEFEKKKKEYDLIPTPKNLEDYYSIDGNLEITIDDMKDDCCCDIYENIKIKNDLFNDLDKCFNDLISLFNNISEKINNISNIFTKLSASYSLQNNEIKSILYNFSKIFSNMKKFYSNQEIFYQDEFKDDFKFINKEINSFSLLNDLFHKGRNNYLEYKKSFEKGNAIIGEEYEKNFKIKKVYYGFILNRYLDEFFRVNSIHSKKLKYMYDIFENRNKKMINDYMNFNLDNLV